MHEEVAGALSRLVGTLERHLDAAATKREGAEQIVEQAYAQVEDAFLAYEEALANAYDEYLPIELAEDQ